MGYSIKGKSKCQLCGETAVSRRLCRPHYNKAWKAGLLGQYAGITERDSFESRIQKTDSCWIWTGTKNGYGYGVFLLPGAIPVRAHRYSYELYLSKIPNGKIVMHICDNPPCVNPAHLRISTKDDNNKDTAQKRRHHYGLEHWNGRLSDDDIAKIRASNEQTTFLAKVYGVNQSHISRIKNGVRRKS